MNRQFRIQPWDFEHQISILKKLTEKTCGIRELMDSLKIPQRPLYRNLSKLNDNSHIQIEKRGEGRRSHIQITPLGSRYLVKNRPLADFVKQFLIAFDNSYSEFKDKGAIDTYRDFLNQIQTPIREMLNPELNEHKDYYDVSLVIRGIQVNGLLSDAKLAKDLGQFLTLNHRYILERLDGESPEDLIDHNAKWKKRIDKTKFTGREFDIKVDTKVLADLHRSLGFGIRIEREITSNHEIEILESKIDPHIIVMKEMEQREKELGTQYNSYYTQVKQNFRFLNDGYTYEYPWIVLKEKLRAHAKKAKKEYEKRIKIH